MNDCAIPKLGKVETTPYGLPSCSSPDISPLCHEFKELLRSTPGTTTMKQHFIPTLGPPVKIPPRRVPANYRKAVDEQLHAMLEEMGIIEESSSPWMAPAVYVSKKSWEIRICVDYRELNKKTIKGCLPIAPDRRGTRHWRVQWCSPLWSFTAGRPPHTQRQEVSVRFVKSGLCRSCFLSSKNG